MRFLLILAVLYSAPTRAQDIDVEEVVRHAEDERLRARCMLRAAGRSKRLAERYGRTQSAAARTRLAAELVAVETARGLCISLIEVARHSGVGSVGPTYAPPAAPSTPEVRVRLRVTTSPTEHIPELLRLWARGRQLVRRCVQRALNIDPSPFDTFAVRYVVTAEGQMGPLEGVPPRLRECFEYFRRGPHPEPAYGMSVRVEFQVDMEARRRAERDFREVDFPTRPER